MITNGSNAWRTARRPQATGSMNSLSIGVQRTKSATSALTAVRLGAKRPGSVADGTNAATVGATELRGPAKPLPNAWSVAHGPHTTGCIKADTRGPKQPQPTARDMDGAGVLDASDLRVLGKAPILQLPATGDTYAASETGSCAKQLLNPVPKARNDMADTPEVRFLFFCG